ncbi:MAG: c-type cytochrome [Gemmatimonadota bacterium]
MQTPGRRNVSGLTALAALLMFGFFLPMRAAGQVPEKFENLQVLPKDISRGDLIATMRGFTTSLGVRCPFCHVGQEGADLSTFDFKADDKPTKGTARIMMRMVHMINDSILPQLDTVSHGEGVEHDHSRERLQLQCVTCHRGNSRPITIEAVIAKVIADSGVPAAVATYRDLKTRYFGGFTYDFRERPLNGIASGLIRQNKAEDAVTLLTLNLETNPDTWATHLLLGDAYVALGKKDLASASYRRSLELQPDNPPVKAKLDALQQ